MGMGIVVRAIGGWGLGICERWFLGAARQMDGRGTRWKLRRRGSGCPSPRIRGETKPSWWAHDRSRTQIGGSNLKLQEPKTPQKATQKNQKPVVWSFIGKVYAGSHWVSFVL